MCTRKGNDRAYLQVFRGESKLLQGNSKILNRVHNVSLPKPVDRNLPNDSIVIPSGQKFPI